MRVRGHHEKDGGERECMCIKRRIVQKERECIKRRIVYIKREKQCFKDCIERVRVNQENDGV